MSIFLLCHLGIVIPVKTGIQSLGIPALLLQKPWIPPSAGWRTDGDDTQSRIVIPGIVRV
ncbi:hypothetical protein A2372_02210 [Candidatus Wolfebacteria bacterium RIFOXYB1_FULL_54_12]|uniref:Uncharacterized protein n=1 Tax=Candidatus Wolfebacteria bacterium RIFOXYB1_FULL_54_12 TaxID=1802559 RepID=A0A1F8DXJ1_9BACT|nr:MAG: hypothetical protein A2372_02210 [Candidatus Wolfebacteria bacterium RIFOXYB1_FULL_54_12]